MRCFIGMALTDPARDRLAELQHDLLSRAGAAASRLRPLAPAGFHLTLKFLGEISDVQCPPLLAALRALTHPPFRAALRGIDAFPTSSRPRVVVACVDEGKKDVVTLMHA